MCTSGAIAVQGKNDESIILAGKTHEFFQTGIWHAVVNNQAGGYKFMGFSVMQQAGINSGINEKGLTVILSFFDHQLPQADNAGGNGEDTRGLANAAILGNCTNIKEAIEYMYDYVPQHKMPGGNHLLVDAHGQIAVFEQCRGVMDHKIYSAEGYTARGNNALIIAQEEQKKLPADVQADRNMRYQTMMSAFKEIKTIADNESIDKQTVLQKYKQTLCQHVGDGSAAGSICAHGITINGARLYAPKINWTLSGVIFDIAARKMHYTIGCPCQNEWKVMCLHD